MGGWGMEPGAAPRASLCVRSVDQLEPPCYVKTFGELGWGSVELVAVAAELVASRSPLFWQAGGECGGRCCCWCLCIRCQGMEPVCSPCSRGRLWQRSHLPDCCGFLQGQGQELSCSAALRVCAGGGECPSKQGAAATHSSPSQHLCTRDLPVRHAGEGSCHFLTAVPGLCSDPL